MISKIPKQFVKREKLGFGEEVSAVQDYLNTDSPYPSFSIRKDGFEFSVRSREDIEKIKEVIEFALKVVPNPDNKWHE
jgi:hypothetical protein